MVNELYGTTPASSNELYHYGRKGMRWYQHIFTKDKGSSEGAKSSKKKVSEMTTEELKSGKARLDAEKAYLDSYKNRYPKTNSFAKKMVDEAVKPALVKAGKNVLNKALDKAVSEVFKDDSPEGKELSALKKEVEKQELIGRIAKAKISVETAKQKKMETESKARERKVAEDNKARMEEKSKRAYEQDYAYDKAQEAYRDSLSKERASADRSVKLLPGPTAGTKASDVKEPSQAKKNKVDSIALDLEEGTGYRIINSSDYQKKAEQSLAEWKEQAERYSNAVNGESGSGKKKKR